MKYYVLTYLAAFSCVAAAQSSSTIFTRDLNGNVVSGPTTDTTATPTDRSTTELSQSLNGRTVPLERTENRVISDSPSKKITESIVRKYNPEGQVISTERTVTEEEPRANGSTARATVYRTDVNGNTVEAERRTIEKQTQGSTTTTGTTVQRPDINGSFQTTEKRDLVTSVQGDLTRNSETVYRPSVNGNLDEAVRDTSETRKTGNQTVVSTAYYEPDANGRMQLSSQTAATTTTSPDGSEVTTLNIYGRNLAGVAREANPSQALQEQQTISRSKRADGSVVQTTSVRRPTINDPNSLGAPSTISETVCKGKCDPPKP